MQRKWIPALLSCLALTAFNATAQDQTKEAKIERILKLTNADAMIDQMFDQMKKMAMSQMPADASPEARAKVEELQGKTMDLIRTRLSWEKMRPAYVKIYVETFSDEEISGMLAFYESPAGRAVLSKMPTLMTKSMSYAQEQMRDLIPEMERLRKEMMQK